MRHDGHVAAVATGSGLFLGLRRRRGRVGVRAPQGLSWIFPGFCPQIHERIQAGQCLFIYPSYITIYIYMCIYIYIYISYCIPTLC